MRAGPIGRIRRTLRTGGALLVALALACGDRRDEADDDLQAPGPAIDRLTEQIAPSEGVDRADTRLTIAVRRLPDALDPLGTLDPWGGRIAEDLVFEGLTRRDATGDPWVEPALADVCVSRPEIAPVHVYCHLRGGLKFHDGEPVTPDDVLYSLGWWLDSRRATMRLRMGLGGLKMVEMVDGPPGGLPAGASRDPGRWVHIAWTRPEPLALEQIADMKVVPRTRHRGRSTSFGRMPIGTGPMRVVTLSSDHIALEPYPIVEPLPDGTLSRLIVREMTDGAEVLVAMRRGDIQIAAELAAVHVPEELAQPGMAPRFRAFVLSPPQYDLLLYNQRRGVQAGPKMRGVLDDGIPRAVLADALAPMPPPATDVPIDQFDPVEIDLSELYAAGPSARWGMAGLPAPLDAQQDDATRTRAIATLDELDWVLERGVRRRATGALRVVLMWSGAPGDGRVLAHGIRDAWREIGIVTTFATAGWAYLLSLMSQGEFDVALVRLAERSDADLYPYFHSRGDLNLAGVTDIELDQALEAYRAAATPSERRAAHEALAQRLRILGITSMLRAPTQVMLVSGRVQGLEFVDDLPRLDRLRLAPLESWILGRRPARDAR